MPSFPKLTATITVAIAANTLLSAQDADSYELDPVVVNANRLDPASAAATPAVSLIEPDQIEMGKFGDITDALSTYPGFVTFRRTHTTAAHPTTQGIRLRNLGANATSRTLVLHDGVPQNDPFGAWVYWHQFDLAQTEAISIHPSGSGELWGNFGGGGVISIVSKDSLPGSARVNLDVGTSGRLDLQASATQALSDSVTLDLGLHTFTHDGFYTLEESQRGPVDQRANSESSAINARIRWNPTEDWKTHFSVKAFEESRNNGTPLTVNETKALNLSVIAERQLDHPNSKLNVSAYYQNRSFENVFSSVNDDRSSENPALDQYDVPAESFGGAIAIHSGSADDTQLAAGFDFREVTGSVNERFRNLGSGFTRDRNAGGKQLFLGAFASYTRKLSDQDRISATLRIDRVEQSDGFRIETDTTNGNTLLSDSYADRSSTPLSGDLSWRRQFSDTLTSQTTVFAGFRTPTLNELYRPFRVRNDITEANPELVDERQQGVEFTLNFEPTAKTQLRVSTFYYDAEEVIANALLTTASGFDPRFGFIPEGGSGSLRVNLDQTHVSGFDLQLHQSLTNSLRASLAVVYADSEVSSDELSQFEGVAFPQSAPFRANLSLDWAVSESLSIWTAYRWADRTYEDLGNATRLGATGDLSIGARYLIDDTQSVSFAIANALDEQNITGRASNGLLTIDAPREFRLTYTWRR